MDMQARLMVDVYSACIMHVMSWIQSPGCRMLAWGGGVSLRRVENHTAWGLRAEAARRSEQRYLLFMALMG
jgi:hypothetical protein